MTTNDAFDRALAAWLEAEARQPIPDRYDAVLVATRGRGQRAWWSSLERWLPVDTTLNRPHATAAWLAWALLVVAVGVALIAAIVVVGTRDDRVPAPFGPASNGRIIYSFGGDIRAIDADGQDERTIVADPAADVAPLLSNDGTRFIFLRRASAGFDVFVADVDGSDVRKLTATPLVDASWADWSPDGSRILLVHSKSGAPVVSIMPTDGNGRLHDLALGDLIATQPTWRPPDGREIVFRGERAGNHAIYVVAADGGVPRRVAPLESWDGAYLGMRVAPDGDRLTYWHDIPVDDAINPEGTKSEVHVLDVGTKVDQRIGFDATSRHELMPTFSPDGQSLLFVRFNRTPDAASLVIAATDGTDGLGRQVGPYQAWHVGGALENPMVEFSPDGREVILSRGGGPLLLIDVTTGDVRTVGPADFVAWQRLAPPSD